MHNFLGYIELINQFAKVVTENETAIKVAQEHYVMRCAASELKT